MKWPLLTIVANGIGKQLLEFPYIPPISLMAMPQLSQRLLGSKTRRGRGEPYATPGDGSRDSGARSGSSAIKSESCTHWACAAMRFATRTPCPFVRSNAEHCAIEWLPLFTDMPLLPYIQRLHGLNYEVKHRTYSPKAAKPNAGSVSLSCALHVEDATASTCGLERRKNQSVKREET